MFIIPSAQLSMVKEEIKSYDNDYEATIKGGIGLTITVICDVEDADNLELRVKLYGIPFLTGTLIEEPLPDSKLKITYRVYSLGFYHSNIYVIINDNNILSAQCLLLTIFFIVYKVYYYDSINSDINLQIMR